MALCNAELQKYDLTFTSIGMVCNLLLNMVQ